MTTRESYVLGWAFGRLEYLLRAAQDPQKSTREYDMTGAKVSAAAMRPMTGFAQIHAVALDRGVLSESSNRDLAAALDEIDACGPVCASNGTEVVQPLPNQASWDLGRYKALGGSPLPPISGSYDIKAKRQTKGMTQAQLAEALGADQAQVSRWEKGINVPTDETLAKIKELLG